jgi:hypothetical protein
MPFALRSVWVRFRLLAYLATVYEYDWNYLATAKPTAARGQTGRKDAARLSACGFFGGFRGLNALPVIPAEFATPLQLRASSLRLAQH